MKVAFDASWGHRRNANNCLGGLMDLNTNTIISFHIAHHRKEENETFTSTDKHRLKIIPRQNFENICICINLALYGKTQSQLI